MAAPADVPTDESGFADLDAFWESAGAIAYNEATKVWRPTDDAREVFDDAVASVTAAVAAEEGKIAAQADALLVDDDDFADEVDFDVQDDHDASLLDDDNHSATEVGVAASAADRGWLGGDDMTTAVAKNTIFGRDEENRNQNIHNTSVSMIELIGDSSLSGLGGSPTRRNRGRRVSKVNVRNVKNDVQERRAAAVISGKTYQDKVSKASVASSSRRGKKAKGSLDSSLFIDGLNDDTVLEDSDLFSPAKVSKMGDLSGGEDNDYYYGKSTVEATPASRGRGIIVSPSDGRALKGGKSGRSRVKKQGKGKKKAAAAAPPPTPHTPRVATGRLYSETPMSAISVQSGEYSPAPLRAGGKSRGRKRAHNAGVFADEIVPLTMTPITPIVGEEPPTPIDAIAENARGRKSKRNRFSPLAFWKNERVVYGKNNEKEPTVVGVMLRKQS